MSQDTRKTFVYVCMHICTLVWRNSIRLQTYLLQLIATYRCNWYTWLHKGIDACMYVWIDHYMHHMDGPCMCFLKHQSWQTCGRIFTCIHILSYTFYAHAHARPSIHICVVCVHICFTSITHTYNTHMYIHNSKTEKDSGSERIDQLEDLLFKLVVSNPQQWPEIVDKNINMIDNEFYACELTRTGMCIYIYVCMYVYI
jgi:hypothetical protein